VKSPTRKAAPINDQMTAKSLQPSLIIPSKNVAPKKEKAQVAKVQKEDQEVKFKVLLEVTDKLANTQESKWQSLNYSIQVRKEGQSYKYLAIGFKSYEEATKAKSQLRKSGFNQAFVVAYQNGNRIKMEDALK